MGLEGNVPFIKAKRLLEQARKGEIELTANGWFDLTLEVTGSREAAEKAHNDYIKRCYAENKTPQ